MKDLETANNKELEIARKKSLEILDNILQVLQDGKIHTVSEIAQTIKSHWRTVKNQLDIIIKIQNMPKIEVLEGAKHILVRKVQFI